MDMMAELHAINYSPEAVRARQVRRAARQQLVWSQLAEALGKPKTAAGPGWNITPEQRIDEGDLIGAQHPGAAALLIVRKALDEFRIPTKYDLRYRGMKRVSGHGAFRMEEGVVFVQAQLNSISGARHFVDVPVVVMQGRLLAPSICLHQGVERILTQHTFDDILGMGEFKRAAPDRLNMFSPPPEKGEQPRREAIPLVRPGMYKVLPTRMLSASKRELVQAAVRGQDKAAFYAGQTLGAVEPGAVGSSVPGAGDSHLDPAERPTKDHLWTGAHVKATKEVVVQGREGARFRIPRGEQGVVIRDVDGCNRVYYVRWEDLGYAASVAREALRLG